MQRLVGAAVLIGAARSISVVLADGHVIDTIVQGLACPADGKLAGPAALLDGADPRVIHLPVSSVSGQAAPHDAISSRCPRPWALAAGNCSALSDRCRTGRAHRSDQRCVMAVLLAAGVPFSRWFGFAVGGFLLLTAIGGIGVLVAATSGTSSRGRWLSRHSLRHPLFGRSPNTTTVSPDGSWITGAGPRIAATSAPRRRDQPSPARRPCRRGS